jgi:hypothetical protein
MSRGETPSISDGSRLRSLLGAAHMLVRIGYFRHLQPPVSVVHSATPLIAAPCPAATAVSSSPKLDPTSPDHSAAPLLQVPAHAFLLRIKKSSPWSSRNLSANPPAQYLTHAGSTSVSSPAASFHCPPLMYLAWSGSDSARGNTDIGMVSTNGRCRIGERYESWARSSVMYTQMPLTVHPHCLDTILSVPFEPVRQIDTL